MWDFVRDQEREQIKLEDETIETARGQLTPDLQLDLAMLILRAFKIT
jgi:hypothetical protein